LCTFVAFGFLWVFFRPKLKEVNPVPARKIEPFSVVHIIVILVCLTTIGLWAVGTQVSGLFGSNGIVALFPVVVFFALPILEKSDFKSLSWDVLMLLAGGIALGDAVKSSGLLQLMTDQLGDLVEKSALWIVCFAFVSFIWLFGNFMSHTVAAIIVLPVIANVGCNLGNGNCQEGHFALLVLLV